MHEKTIQEFIAEIEEKTKLFTEEQLKYFLTGIEQLIAEQLLNERERDGNE